MRYILTAVLFMAGALLSAFVPAGAVKNLKTGTYIRLEGHYKHHVQGVASDGEHIYWSITETIVKTDIKGRILKTVEIPFHAGDPCWNGGKLYVPVCRSGFNEYLKNRQSQNFVYVYDSNLKLLAKHSIPEAVFGAGAIEFRSGKFYIGVGRPKELQGNEILEYDGNFRFIRSIPFDIKTRNGTQTINWDGRNWWLGCYGDNTMIMFDGNFKNPRYAKKIVTGYGNIPLDGSRILLVRNRYTKFKRCIVDARVIDFKIPAAKKKSKSAAAVKRVNRTKVK